MLHLLHRGGIPAPRALALWFMALPVLFAVPLAAQQNAGAQAPATRASGAYPGPSP